MRRLVLAIVILAGPAAAGELEIGDDGWYSWRVDKHESTGHMCCYSSGREKGCDLDGERGSHSVASATPGRNGFARLYAKLDNGRVIDLHTASDSCPVTTVSPIADLGLASATDSIRWLESQVGKSGNDETMLAISVHADTIAHDSLRRYAEHGDNSKLREQAVFWMGQHRGDAAAADILEFAKNGKGARFRDQAVFALSQLPESTNVESLETLLRDTSARMHVRKQALFWLAQLDSDEAFEVLDGLLDP